MNRILLLILAAGLLSAISATAGDSQPQWETRVVVASDYGTGSEPIRIELSGEELGFDLQELQFGESRSVVDSAGRSILITRTEKGYNFDVDGKTVSMPAFEHTAEHIGIVDLSGSEFGVDAMSSGMTFAAAGPAGITVVTPKPLDENTQESIRSVLQAAGHNEVVTFIDQSTMPQLHSAGTHAIRVVRKDVHVSE